MTQIMIIEDDQNIQQLLQNAIYELRTDIELACSASAGEALDMARQKHFDAFIVDIQLTDYKGTDLVQQLRSISEYRFTPIIFETAIITEELRAYRELKCYHYLMKPYTKQEVQQVVSEVLEYLGQPKAEGRTLRIEQKGFIFEYRLQDILFIESFGKNMVIHLLTEQGEQKEERIAGYSLKSILESLGEGSFIQCHKSYIVNTSYIEEIRKTDQQVKLRHCDQLLPIGLKYRDQVIRGE
ncbi:LytTR family DNA-binding domain-containing protein [Paenibacillus sp. KQZ6P-2]|uniref:LytTR family DNA-binding domain-containing protein n=1 Tax=Paenibacillus mangrovi TaxID=2931978 RepID=A0A9X1WLM9_9BACL|nr:LytTR family DNA-binding domain-containing protein [Paenibacillus mangrovi]MCJ8010941.1 LytTR family DNA-binding domain-containing protein [Paenibacillus mangrovi]